MFWNPGNKNMFYSSSEDSKHEKPIWKTWMFQSLVIFHVVSKAKLNISFSKSLPQLKQQLIIARVWPRKDTTRPSSFNNKSTIYRSKTTSILDAFVHHCSINKVWLIFLVINGTYYSSVMHKCYNLEDNILQTSVFLCSLGDIPGKLMIFISDSHFTLHFLLLWGLCGDCKVLTQTK